MRFRPEVKPASRLDLSRAYAIDLARSLRRMAVKNVRRTHDIVNDEYNVGEWGKALAARGWMQAPSLEQFLIGENETPRLAKVDGEIVRISTRDYYRYRIGALSELIARHAGTADELVELGSGLGQNLFMLSFDQRWKRLRGFDIAPNGIEAGRQIANRFGLGDRISFDQLDLTNGDDPHFRELAGATVFTYFCIEQIPYAVEAVVENIMRARPARVIHIEPAVDMLKLSQPRDFASRVYIKSMDYQTRLFKLLDSLDNSGRIRILARERMQYAPSLHNDGLLYVWEPVQ
ncbi:class I SAM-dependent methyltransferase [Bradyrhizobium jicamae]|nr:class I SAM-dependent methyltransferase [Bradyrhizobium jicamae]